MTWTGRHPRPTSHPSPCQLHSYQFPQPRHRHILHTPAYQIPFRLLPSPYPGVQYSVSFRHGKSPVEEQVRWRAFHVSGSCWLVVRMLAELTCEHLKRHAFIIFFTQAKLALCFTHTHCLWWAGRPVWRYEMLWRRTYACHHQRQETVSSRYNRRRFSPIFTIRWPMRTRNMDILREVWTSRCPFCRAEQLYTISLSSKLAMLFGPWPLIVRKASKPHWRCLGGNWLL